MKSLINYFLPEMDIRETKIPFRAVSTDLITGKKVIFSEGPLRQAVLASCSVPGALAPVRHGANGFLLTAASRVLFLFTPHARPELTSSLP
ncbi:MAG: hypothetical protein MZV70_60060 [Desulfobacterales bacterium]|nr:hypothetical protein [Desulfobacterales bacterium]